MAAPAPAPSPETAAGRRAGGRLVSVDALRGFDMFWIIGAGPLVQALERMNGGVTGFFSAQLQHVPWEGFHFNDLIFPLFIFIVGVSLVFSVDRMREAGGPGRVWGRILARSILLYLLGVIYYGGISRPWPDVALGGVLQRLAACYLLAAAVYYPLASRPWWIAAVAAALLAGYALLLAFVPFPDFTLDEPTVTALSRQVGSTEPAAIAGAVTGRVSGVYERGRNLTNYIDFLYLYAPGRTIGHVRGYFISEGLLSTLPAVGLCLLGVLAGMLLKRGPQPPARKAAWLVAGGAALVLVGLLWSLQMPIIKRLWTSSFCAFAAGWSALLLGLFYYLVDVRGHQAWCRPFVWIGMNPITIYMVAEMVSFPRLAERLVGGDVRAWLDAHVAAGFGGLVVAVAALTLAVLLCWFLHRRQVFIRV